MMTAWRLEAINKVQGAGVEAGGKKQGPKDRCSRRSGEGIQDQQAGAGPDMYYAAAASGRGGNEAELVVTVDGLGPLACILLLRNSSKRMNCDPQSYRPHSAPSGPRLLPQQPLPPSDRPTARDPTLPCRGAWRQSARRSGGRGPDRRQWGIPAPLTVRTQGGGAHLLGRREK
jgi:hypothetical protein